MLNGLLEFIPEIQIADATEAVTDWLTDTFPLFSTRLISILETLWNLSQMMY